MNKKASAIFTATLLTAVSYFTASCDNPADHDGHDHDDHDHSDAPTLPASPTARPADASVYIISPKDGAEVGKTFTIQFGLKGMGVMPAGAYKEDAATGHRHLVIDGETPNLTVPFPKDETRLHFGGGQTETSLTLAPGEHTLQLVLADHNHIPHNPPLVSKTIKVTVK